MISAYETLNEVYGYMRTSTLKTIAPRVASNNHIVSTRENRGGHYHYVYIPTAARLLVNCLDTKVLTADGIYGWSYQTVADYNGERFVYVNGVYHARISRALYEKLVSAGACEAGQDLRKLIKIDLRVLPVFPVLEPDEKYLTNKIELLKLEKAAATLAYLKREAAKKVCNNTLNNIDNDIDEIKNNSNIELEYYVYNVKPMFEVTNIINKSDYRIEIPNGKRVSVQYTVEHYNKICSYYEQVKEKIKDIRQQVRLYEMSFLEHRPWQKIIVIGDYSYSTEVCKKIKTVKTITNLV